MTPAELLTELRARGITVTTDGDRLKADALRGVLSPELRMLLAEYKTALIALLSAPSTLRDLIEVEAELVALFDEWDRAGDQGNPRWAQRWAALAIEAGLPCYPDGIHNAGADGWRAWAVEAAQ